MTDEQLKLLAEMTLLNDARIEHTLRDFIPLDKARTRHRKNGFHVCKSFAIFTIRS